MKRLMISIVIILSLFFTYSSSVDAQKGTCSWFEPNKMTTLFGVVEDFKLLQLGRSYQVFLTFKSANDVITSWVCPAWYAQKINFILIKGDHITIDGWFGPFGEFYISRVSNWRFRGTDGTPAWR